MCAKAGFGTTWYGCDALGSCRPDAMFVRDRSRTPPLVLVPEAKPWGTPIEFSLIRRPDAFLCVRYAG